jgi:iron complex outermembrane receptor protein
MQTYRISLFLAAVVAVLAWSSVQLFAQQEAEKAQEQPSEATEGQPMRMEETQVTAEHERTHGYAAEDAVSATKTDTPLLEIPQAVSVVPRTLLDDRDAHKLDDVLQNVSGVTVGGYYGEWDYYRIRGFDVSYSGTYLDGLLNESAPGEEPWGLERVEVVKGPASSLYGSGTPGGFVNLVSKRPRPEIFADAQFTIGSYEYYEPAVDLNATLNDAKTIYARLNFLYRNSGLFVDYAGAERVFVAPSLTWKITPDTFLTLLTSYKDDSINLAFPLPARGTVLPNPNGEIPISRYIGNPARPNDDWERSIRLGYEFRHRFTNHFAVRQNFRWFRLDFRANNLSYPASLEVDDRTLALSGYRNHGNYEGLRVDSALDATFATGPVEHTLTFGVDYRQTDSFFDSQDGGLIYLDVFDPDYGALPPYTYGPSSIYKGWRL